MAQRILIVEDDRDLSEALSDTLELAGYATVVAGNGEEAVVALASHDFSLVLSDVHMPGMDGHELLRTIHSRFPALPVLLMTAYGTIQKAVEAMREGAADYLVKPFEADVLVSNVGLYCAPATNDLGEGPVAVDPRSQELLTLARRVAESEATVMLTGESGTGKEVLARYIHFHSSRAEAPFIAINCAAIPENMLEATLFGYEKGAFTGAYKATPGKFEQAQGGTLLLDEISEMDLGLQAKLLRVLQERELERLGGGRMIELDVRVLATSNRDMRDEVKAGRFREDLYYRLNVFPLHIPALRERPADIIPLAEHLLAKMAQRTGRQIPYFSETARQQLLGYGWPGNVRELENLIQRALILSSSEQITEQALHFETAVPLALDQVQPLQGNIGQLDGSTLNDDLKASEFQLIQEALKVGNRKAAAEKLGISPRTLRHKLQKLREAGYELSERVGA
jgi:two-component system response regulator FlrC